MSKKRRAKQTGRKAVWGSKEEAALLGLLDFCIKHKHAFPFNEENVVGHLYPTGNPYDIYTWDQINRKLDQLWRSYGGDDSLNKADIYVKGSVCLAGLVDDERSTIESEVERLEKQLKPRTSRNKALGIPVTRKTASESPCEVKRGQSHPSECDISSVDCLTPRARRHQTRELAKQSKRKRESPEGSLREDDTPRKITRQTKKGPRNRCKQQGKQSSENLERGTERQGRQQLVVGDSELELSCENENDSGVLAVSISEDRGPHEFASLRLGSEIRQLQRDSVPSPTALERIHRAALRKKDEKIMELEETIKANEARLDELQTQLDSFGSLQERRQEGGDSLEVLVSNLNQEIRHLKKAKDDCRNIGTFTKLAGSYEAARQEMNMETQVPSIRRLMKNILGGCDDDTTLKVPSPNSTAGLRALLSFGFGLDDQTPLRKEQLESLLSNRPPYSIIETLIEAAVCTWVFESDFPNFAQQPAVLGLFTKYRELIAAQDGAVALRNLDLASHHALINAPRFHKMMDTEAESLATSLSKTLAPFFARNAEESEENVFETWGEEESVWKARQKRLVAIFKESLKLKANSLLTPERYELIHYAPGTIFDSATMDVETIDGAPVEAKVGEGHRVEHCLHVAIQAYTRETVKDMDPVSKATIQSKNFTRGDAIRPLGVATPIVLAKAVVVLRKHADDDAHSDDTVQ